MSIFLGLEKSNVDDLESAFTPHQSEPVRDSPPLYRIRHTLPGVRHGIFASAFPPPTVCNLVSRECVYKLFKKDLDCLKKAVETDVRTNECNTAHD